MLRPIFFRPRTIKATSARRYATFALMASMLAFSVPTPVTAIGLRDAINSAANLAAWTTPTPWLGLLTFQGKSQRELPQEPSNNSGVKPQSRLSKTELQSRIAAIRINPSGKVNLESRQPMLFVGVPVDSEETTIHGLSVDWTSSDTQVVFIRPNGQAVAGKPGKATITATTGSVTATVDVVVTASKTQKEFGGKKSENSSRGKEKIASLRRPRPTKRNASQSQLKHHESHSTKSLIVPQPLPTEDPLPDDETNSLYESTNLVGSPPGKTKPGATTASVAANATETNGNRNFTFALPITGFTGRGVDVSLSLIYNSQLWNKSTAPANNSTWMTYDVDSGWTGPGFRIGFGQIEDQGSFGFTLTDADGTRHALVHTGGNNYATIDGTFVQFTGGSGWGTLFYPDGTRVTYGAAGGGLRSYPTMVTDRNGNYVLISYVNGVGPKISSIQDTLQRYINFHYASNGDLVTITAPGLTGFADRQVIRFYYTDITIGGNLFDSAINVSGPSSAHTLQYVYFPASSDGTNARIGYEFEYSPYGMIRQITELRGMTVDSASTSSTGSVSTEGTMATQTTYSYPTSGQNLSDVPKFETRTDEWAGRTTGGNAPYYTFGAGTVTGEKISTVTSPDETVRETHAIDNPGNWNDGLVKQTVIKYGSTIFSKTDIDWEQTPTNGPPRIASIRVTNDGSTPLTKATVFGYTSYNNLSSLSERDFTNDGSVSSTELRRTETTYVTSSNYINRNLLRLPSTVKVFAGGATTPISRVDYAYDNYGTNHANLTARDDIIMHDPAFDPFQVTQESCDWVCREFDQSWTNCIDWEWVCTYFNPYDAATDYRGNVTSVTTYSDAPSAGGAITNATTYDIAGNAITTEVDCCQLKSFTYSGAGANEPHDYAYVISVTDGDPGGMHLTSSATYDYNTGLLATGTDANNQTTSNFYNANSLRLDHVAYPNGGGTFFAYSDSLVADAAGSPHFFVETTTKLDNNGTGGVARYASNRRFFDGRGAPTRIMVYQATDGWSTQDIDYDSTGRAFRSSNPYSAAGYSSTPASASSLFWITSHFDRLGRVYQVDMPRGDNDNSLITSVTTTFDGIYTTVADQTGKMRRQKVDALGRVTRLDEPTTAGLGSVASPNQPTNYYWDVLGNLVRINQNSQNRYFKYDSLSRLIRERQVEQDVNSSYDLSDSLTGNSSWSRKLQYNSSSLITDAYDAKGVHAQFSYDGLNRLTTVTYSDSTPAARYYYDSQTLPSGAPNYTHSNSAGRLLAMTYGSSNSITGNYFAYDAMGQVTIQKQVTGSTTYGLSYTYNLAGLPTGETYPSGRVIGYAYDDVGRLSTVSDGSTTFASGFQFTEHGGLKSETFGNGMVHSLDYNRRLQAKQITLKQNSSATTPLQQFDYAFGAFNSSTGSVDTSKNNGQIGSITSKINGTTQWLQGLSYDELGRLSNVKEYQSGNLSSQTYSQSYTYDRYGNRFQSANATLGLPAVSASEISAATNRFISTGSTPTTYDAAGNITTDTKFRNLKYDYDANGRMTASKLLDNTIIQSAVYDCGGQRVRTTASNVTRTMVYDIFGQNVADYTGSTGATLERENIYRGGTLLATDEKSNAAAPSALVATPSTSNVALSWTAASGATNYRIERKGAGGSYALLSTTSSTSKTDDTASSGNAYLYRVCAADAAGNCTSSYSNIGLGMAFSFTDPTIVSYLENPASATSIQAVHITQLRTAVNAVRSLAGLPAASWTNSVSPGATIFADDVRDLRSKLGDALVALSIQTSSYTDSTITSFIDDPGNVTTVKADHIRELRQRATRGAGNSGSGGSSGGLKYVLLDLKGTTRAIMSNNGGSSTVIARNDYLPFGEAIGAGLGLRTAGQGFGAINTNRWNYGMLERDSATGLDHTWWRKYENASGRWSTPDPYIGSMTIANPQSFNRYSHVLNDPINLIDPTGLFCVEYVTYEDTPTELRVILHRECFFEDDGGTSFAPFGGPGGGPGVGGPISGDSPQDPAETIDWQLFADIWAAIKALQRQSCRDLFSANVDPIDLLGALAAGNAGIGSITRGPLPNDTDAAETKGILGHITVTKEDGTTFRQSIFTGANIVINSNDKAPYQAGYKNFLNVQDDSVHRAVTLIHELGHAAMFIYGAGATRVLDDQKNTPQSQSNSQLVYDNCFK